MGSGGAGESDIPFCLSGVQGVAVQDVLAEAELGGKDIAESGDLLYEGERTEVADWLRAYGWAITTETNAQDLMAASNRAVPPGLDNAVPESVFVEGRLG